MTITAKPLADLSSTTVIALLNEFAQRVQEDNPTLQTSRGVLRDTLGYYHALGAARLSDLLDQYNAGRSVAVLQADPAAADAALVDDVLSNFGVTRKEGQHATGQVVIVLTSDNSVTIGKNVKFEAKGLAYLTTNVFSAKAEEALLTGSTDRLITPTADGHYQFVVDVIAEEAGAAYTLPKGTTLVPTITPPGYFNSYAYTDFTAGLDPETNAELIARLNEGLAAKTLGNRVSMFAALKSNPSFERVIRSSVIGLGQPEMRRNRHSVFPASIGGYLDWYLRTTLTPQVFTVVKEGVATGDDSNGSPVFRIAITKNDCPGYYEVKEIRPVGKTAALLPDTDLRGVDTSSDNMPDIATSTEAVYSAYQTGVITLTDTTSATSGTPAGTARNFEVDFYGLPQIAELQTYVESADVANLGTDCLVKAPVPCFIRVSITLDRQSQAVDIPQDAIREAVAAEVNKIGWTGRVYGSQLSAAVTALLPSGVVLSGLQMLGRLLPPGAPVVYLRGDSLLKLNEDPVNFVSNRTVQFFSDSTSVDISIRIALPSE